MDTPRRMPHPGDRSVDSEEEFPMAPSEYFFYLLFQAARQRDFFFDRSIAGTGLNTARWRTLAIIRRIKECTMKELALYTTIDRTTLTRSVDQLVEMGLVSRWSPPRDRRKVTLALTQHGEAVYGEAAALLMEGNEALLAKVDRKVLRDGARLLQQVILNMMDDPADAADVIAFGRPAVTDL